MSAELDSYSDDSYEPHNDFVIGGFVGPAVEWLRLEQPWREALQKAGLTEYKARDCEQGDNAFKGRTDRRELQEKFISLIRSVEVGGFATRVDLGAYDKLLERVKAARPKKDHRYFAPFPKVLEMQLQFILKYVTEAFAGATRVNFVFDEGDRFAGSAAELIALHRKNPNLQGGSLLGAVSFGVSSDLVPLQAADLLAYEVHRELRRGFSNPAGRWQSQQLGVGGRVAVAMLDEKAISDWASRYPEALT